MSCRTWETRRSKKRSSPRIVRSGRTARHQEDRPMATDFEIGRVVAVDTAQVSIELNRDLKGMSRSTYEGPQEVGRINSYVIIPVGARRLVAMVTRVVLVEEAEMKADRTMVALPAARRMMKATLIGTIDGRAFQQGVPLFPVLDSPVLVAAQ